jgi:hypothetical protein
VILHAKERQILMPQTFQRLVVQINVSQFHFAIRQRIRINCKVVVVRGDFDLPRLQLLHGMIPAVMAKFQLESFSAQCDSSELMSQADSKNRLPAQQAAD